MSPTKTELRNRAWQRRDGVDPATRADFAARLATIGPRLVSAFAGDGRRPVTALFAPIGSEPDAMALAEALHAQGVPLALPVDWSPGTPLLYRGWAPGDRLSHGPLGIREPLAEAPEREPDVLFLPLLAFDRRGHRIGYGAGNVDRTLGLLRQRKVIRAIGVAFAVQEEAFIPDHAHDQTLDLVVTERDVITCQSDAMRLLFMGEDGR